MAEFVQIMMDWGRMCKDRNCGACNLAGICNTDPESRTYKEIVKIENVVTKWAAEHPEPVYPSIAKYLEQFGITIRRDGSLEADFFKANEPMSADMAKMLGISSGECENEKTD